MLQNEQSVNRLESIGEYAFCIDESMKENYFFFHSLMKWL